jgi:hypothetical protein
MFGSCDPEYIPNIISVKKLSLFPGCPSVVAKIEWSAIRSPTRILGFHASYLNNEARMSRRFWIVLALSLLAIGCESQSDSGTSAGNTGSAGYAEAPQAVRSASDESASPPAPSLQIRSGTSPGAVLRDSVSVAMIIRTGNAYIEVDSLEIAIAQVRRLAESAGGYIANSAIQTGEGQQRQATLEIKIPSNRYDQALGGLAGIGKLISSSTNSLDVGEEFVDVNARVSNARRMEERLVNLLATRTGKLEDVLAVERELARVRDRALRGAAPVSAHPGCDEHDFGDGVGTDTGRGAAGVQCCGRSLQAGLEEQRDGGGARDRAARGRAAGGLAGGCGVAGDPALAVEEGRSVAAGVLSRAQAGNRGEIQAAISARTSSQLRSTNRL